MIVDTHVHFWDPRTLRYPWLEQIPVLERPFLPDDYATATAGMPIEKLVVVECDCDRSESPRELAYFEQLAESEPRLAGIVAFVDLTRDDESLRAIDAAATAPTVKGVRHNIQGEQPGFCLQPAFVNAVRHVGERGLVFDLCVTHDQLGDTMELVRACPDTQFVLDHCAKPAIRDLRTEPWGENIARLAELENVAACKISGLLTEADHRRWRAEDVLAYADHAATCFGAERVMYGSDWPVLTLAGDYVQWLELTQRLTSEWTERARSAFYHDNAIRVYGL